MREMRDFEDVRCYPTAMLIRKTKSLALVAALAASGSLLRSEPVERETHDVDGWSLHIARGLLEENREAVDKARGILSSQLSELVRILPPQVVSELREVPLYFSTVYPDGRPGAAYHPNPEWLRKNGRDPAMVKSVEFTNIAIFEKETVRMPNLVLHELAHAYHHRFLKMGYANPELKKAYDRAVASKSYDHVERWHGNDPKNTFEKAYAMNNPMEYFAETTEAYFGRNDFFPFTQEELKKHDPEMFSLLQKLWRITVPEAAEVLPSPAE